MKIIHVIDSLGVGGGQTMLFELFTSICLHHKDVSQELVLLKGGHVEKKFLQGYGINFQIEDYKTLCKRIRNDKDTVLFVHKLMRTKTSFYSDLLNHIPIIVINHTYCKSAINNRIETCNAVVSVCENMKKTLKRHNSHLRHEVIYNFVNASRYKIPFKSHDKDSNILYTGRINSLNYIKYSDSWVEWCLKTKLPKKMIHEYIGSGNGLAKAKSVIQKVGKKAKNEVHMLGLKTKFIEKVSYIRNWDLFLYEINQDEGLSIAVLEALVCGVPVVCSDHYGNKEIIKNGVNGYVFRDKKEAEEILTDLCKNPDKLQKLKESTQKDFDEHREARHMSQKYIDLSNEILYKIANGEKIEIYSKRKRSKKLNKSDYFKNNRVKIRRKPVRKQKKVVAENIPYKPKKVKFDHIVNSEDKSFVILTSSYNQGQYLHEWSKSIINQDYRPIKVVFVDDCSTDDTSDIIQDVKKHLENSDISIKIISNENRVFCGSSYKIALSNSENGSYFGVLDADDMLVEDACSFIANLYEKHDNISWIYTQYQVCNNFMKPRGKGFSRHPGKFKSLLSLGERWIHGYSHWRTFSIRFPRFDKIFKDGLTCAVDKYMGYRLEEFGDGMFVNKICYLYRSGVPSSISKTQNTRKVWAEIVKEAKQRRKKYKLQPHSIIDYKKI